MSGGVGSGVSPAAGGENNLRRAGSKDKTTELFQKRASGESACGQKILPDTLYKERKRREREDEEKAKRKRALSLAEKNFRLPRPGKPRTPANAPEALRGWSSAQARLLRACQQTRLRISP